MPSHLYLIVFIYSSKKYYGIWDGIWDMGWDLGWDLGFGMGFGLGMGMGFGIWDGMGWDSKWAASIVRTGVILESVSICYIDPIR